VEGREETPQDGGEGLGEKAREQQGGDWRRNWRSEYLRISGRQKLGEDEEKGGERKKTMNVSRASQTKKNAVVARVGGVRKRRVHCTRRGNGGKCRVEWGEYEGGEKST